MAVIVLADPVCARSRRRVLLVGLGSAGASPMAARAEQTHRLAFSNVIISLRVTVTHLVVTGGPPPAMCQAA